MRWSLVHESLKRIKWNEATILAMDNHKLSRRMGELIGIEKHSTMFPNTLLGIQRLN